ncbi:hypothetical protein NW762_014342 [Fusarium torreyae]|uniref:Uncharacterized protein n=1 Tax=Fusarium torreyae TaxID=1237075 RepID=A0A9W8RLT8_9HYPO|nr:hypothetical protein NW762_014342 [Fusarium torreyae]
MYPYQCGPPQELPAEVYYHNGFAQQDNPHMHQQPNRPPPPAFPLPPDPTTKRATMSPSCPILLPSTSIGATLEATPPFTRAYPPVLGSYDIDAAAFLTIIDGLNIALVEPAAFKTLEVAGEGLGFIPNEIAQGAALGLEVAAGTGAAACAYIRTKRLLDRVNREIFTPKGLKMEILKDEEIMKRLGTTAKSLDPQQRLQELGPYIEVLSFDVAPPNKQTNILDRISAKQTAYKQAEKDKEKRKKMDKRFQKREKAAEKYNRPIESIDEHYNSDAESRIEIEARIAKLEGKITDINTKANTKLDGSSSKKVEEIEKRRMKDLAEVERERIRLLEKHDKATAKIQKKAEKKEEEDKKKVAKLEWIMIHTI